MANLTLQAPDDGVDSAHHTAIFYRCAAMFTAASLFGAILFGSIGLGAFFYGRKTAAAKPLIIGFALMVFPYFVSETWLLYAIGAVLTVSLFLFRDWGA